MEEKDRYIANARRVLPEWLASQKASFLDILDNNQKQIEALVADKQALAAKIIVTVFFMVHPVFWWLRYVPFSKAILIYICQRSIERAGKKMIQVFEQFYDKTVAEVKQGTMDLQELSVD